MTLLRNATRISPFFVAEKRGIRVRCGSSYDVIDVTADSCRIAQYGHVVIAIVTVGVVRNLTGLSGSHLSGGLNEIIGRCRNRERSFCSKGAGPPVSSLLSHAGPDLPARESLTTFSPVNRWPVGLRTNAFLPRHLAATGYRS